ncbi:MAG: sigma-70 family RNA polymerase sigma factor [Candidatus Cloacimonadota bacterium]|nr:sigma-70 family RNA polymerase sigma factor [Candidatus Cloacimonadota bacterium]
MNDSMYSNIKNYSLPILKKYLNNSEDQEDILTLVFMRYYLNSSKIEEDKLKNWIQKVTQNAALDLIKKQKNDLISHSVNFDKIEKFYTDTFLHNDEIRSLTEVLAEYKIELKNSEIKLLQNYIEEGRNLRRVAIKKGISYSTLRKRIYRLKSEIRAKYNKQHGMIATKAIVGAKLHENLLNFIKKFKNALEFNSLEKMNIYFRECKIPKQIPKLHIKNIIKYDIKLIGNKKYKLFVHYNNEKNQFSSFITIFEIYNENSIKIIQFPKQPKKILRFELDKEVGDIIIQTNKDGTLKMKKKEILDFIKGKTVVEEICNNTYKEPEKGFHSK